MQNTAIWLVETAYIFLMFLIATVQISMECETQESQAGYLNLKTLEFILT